MKFAALTASTLGILLSIAMMAPPAAFASTTSTTLAVKPVTHSYAIAYDAQIILHPQGFVQNNTTFMPAQDILSTLKAMSINNRWSNGNLVVGHPIPVDLPDVRPLTGKARIYVNGQLFAVVPVVQQADQSGPPTTTQPGDSAGNPSTDLSTTYIPIWYVMQALNQLGQGSGWNGHLWTLGHLFA